MKAHITLGWRLRELTPVEFGATLSMIGVMCVFLALAAIIVLCQVLKRRFRVEKSTEAAERPVEVAIAPTIATYMSTTPYPTPRPIGVAMKRAQPSMCRVAGKIQIMNMRRGMQK